MWETRRRLFHHAVFWAVSYTHLDVYKRQGLDKVIDLIDFASKTIQEGTGNSFTLVKLCI